MSPEFSQWPDLLNKNKRALKTLPESSKYRENLLNIADSYTQKIGVKSRYPKGCQNVVVTGHQAIWHHCGILVKNFITNNFAVQVNGCGVHLVLDHDVCDTALTSPVYTGDNHLNFKKTNLEQSQHNIPLEFRALPNVKHVKFFIDSIPAKEKRFCYNVWTQNSVLNFNNLASFKNVADLITQFQAVLNSALGIDLLYLPISQMSESRCFIEFAISIFTNSVNFANIYNKGISEQIRTRKINPAQTIRPLKIDDKNGIIELPFWLVSSSGERFSLYVTTDNKKNIKFGTSFVILGVLDSSTFDDKAQQFKKIMAKHGYYLRPKAISLTLFVRLYLTDWFIHGIGGGIYETITNYIIEKYYKIKNLYFGIATATLTLSPEEYNHSFCSTSAEFKSQLRKLNFNPEKFIENSLLNKNPVRSLVRKKKKIIEASKNPNLSTVERKLSCKSISDVNKELLKYTGRSREDLTRKAELLQKNKLSTKVTNYREFFFGLFPQKALRNLLT